MSAMKKHYVTFLSPGTLFAEQTTKEIESWNPKAAQKMAKKIVERHGAAPYGFYFTTRTRGPQDFDSKESSRSHMYYLKGRILMLEQIKARGDEKDRILISNLEASGHKRVFENCNGYQWHTPLEDGDVVLEEVA